MNHSGSVGTGSVGSKEPINFLAVVSIFNCFNFETIFHLKHTKIVCFGILLFNIGVKKIVIYLFVIVCSVIKDLSKAKPRFKGVPLQIYFEIAGLTSAKMLCKIQNIVGEERF